MHGYVRLLFKHCADMYRYAYTCLDARLNTRWHKMPKHMLGTHIKESHNLICAVRHVPESIVTHQRDPDEVMIDRLYSNAFTCVHTHKHVCSTIYQHV